MEIKDYKYKSSFASTVRAKIDIDPILAKASLESLKSVIPDFAYDYPDLLPIAFNSCVVNLANLNDDLVDTDTAMKMAAKFPHKFIDIEHSCENIVGHIINYSYSEFSDEYKDGFGSATINPMEMEDKHKPFNLSLCGFIYKAVDPDLAELLVEASNPLSDKYMQVSTSWEVLFNDYDILVGSKLISQGQVITGDDRNKYIPDLRVYGGTGKTSDGKPIYRIIKGDAIPQGIGITVAPAGDVRGILAISDFKKMTMEDKEDDMDASKIDEVIIINPDLTENVIEIAASITEIDLLTAKNTEIQNNLQKSKNNYSQNKTINVKRYSIMKLSDITDEKFSELTAASVRDFLSDEIDKISTQYAEEKDKLDAEVKAKTSEASDFAQKVQEITDELDKVKAELDKEKEARAAQEAEAAFQARMSDVSDKYNLNEKESGIVAKQIKDLDDTSYSNWFSDFEALNENKAKTYVPSESHEAKASVEDILDKAKQTKAKVPNAHEGEKSMLQKFTEAFAVEDVVSK